MKLSVKASSRVLIAVVVVIALGVAFWMLALGPKRDESSELGSQLRGAEASLAQSRSQVAAALKARKQFPVAYQRLVVLGKAVPGDDETPSLLVQVNRIAANAGARFTNINLSAEGAGSSTASTSGPQEGAGGSATTNTSPTEAAAALLPLGARIGPAGLGVMPYTLTFTGDFFEIADFIKGLDSLVKTEESKVSIDGRLITIDGFALSADPEHVFPQLKATFSVTTYLTPPSQGVTGGATPSAPAAAPVTATQASTKTGGSP